MLSAEWLRSALWQPHLREQVDHMVAHVLRSLHWVSCNVETAHQAEAPACRQRLYPAQPVAAHIQGAQACQALWAHQAATRKLLSVTVFSSRCVGGAVL